MESAKNVISNFLGSSGKDTTEVEETTAPAVTNETVTPHRHEETTEALDREVHQDHYHTTGHGQSVSQREGGYESGVTGATGGALGSESTAPGYDRATGDRAGTGTSYGLDNAGSTTAGGLTGSNTSGTDTTRSAAGGLGGTDTYGSDNSRSATAGGLIGTDSTYGSDTTRGATDVDRSGTGPEVSADNTQGTTIGNPRDEANTKAVGADPSEGDNLTSGEQGSRTTRGGANEGEKQGGGEASESHNNLTHELEDTMKGPRDPAVQGEEHPKLTGTGQPGSHSALFGLTPDGKKHNETMKHSTA